MKFRSSILGIICRFVMHTFSVSASDIDFDDKTKEKTKIYIKECIEWFNSMNGKNK